jgi:thioredoxin reductase (NADPH)
VALPVYVLGRRGTVGLSELRSFLDRNGVTHEWIDADGRRAARLGTAADSHQLCLPAVLLGEGTLIEPPENLRELFGTPPAHIAANESYLRAARWCAGLAEALGLATRPSEELFDLAILGAGPAGLTSAVYAASEGLRTVVVERHAPGGQAGTATRIENYPGFAEGISGTELARATRAQATRFGAEILVGVEIVRRSPSEEGTHEFELTNGCSFRARSAIIATGVHYRTLDAGGVEELLGAGVHYGSIPHEAALYRDRDVYIVGGANSAGQAALHFAEYARSVTLAARCESLRRTMSSYLVDRIVGAANVTVRTETEIVRAAGDGRLEELVLADRARGEEVTVRADALFILIGGVPLTGGVEGWLRRDDHGFLATGPDLLVEGGRGRAWPLERDPLYLESSAPGVFVAGDVRQGSIKRVASAVGEGAMAVQLVHRHLS